MQRFQEIFFIAIILGSFSCSSPLVKLTSSSELLQLNNFHSDKKTEETIDLTDQDNLMSQLEKPSIIKFKPSPILNLKSKDYIKENVRAEVIQPNSTKMKSLFKNVNFLVISDLDDGKLYAYGENGLYEIDKENNFNLLFQKELDIAKNKKYTFRDMIAKGENIFSVGLQPCVFIMNTKTETINTYSGNCEQNDSLAQNHFNHFIYSITRDKNNLWLLEDKNQIRSLSIVNQQVATYFKPRVLVDEVEARSTGSPASCCYFHVIDDGIVNGIKFSSLYNFEFSEHIVRKRSHYINNIGDIEFLSTENIPLVQDGLENEALFNQTLSNLKTDSKGNLYLLDGNTFIRKISLEKKVTTLISTLSGHKIIPNTYKLEQAQTIKSFSVTSNGQKIYILSSNHIDEVFYSIDELDLNKKSVTNLLKLFSESTTKNGLPQRESLEDLEIDSKGNIYSILTTTTGNIPTKATYENGKLVNIEEGNMTTKTGIFKLVL